MLKKQPDRSSRKAWFETADGSSLSARIAKLERYLESAMKNGQNAEWAEREAPRILERILDRAALAVRRQDGSLAVVGALPAAQEEAK